MSGDQLTVLGMAVVAVVGTSIWFARARRRVSSAHRFARAVDLRLDETAEAEIAQRLARRQVAGVATGALAAVLTALLVDPADGFGAFLLVVVAAFAGKALGGVLVAAYESTRPLPPAPRIARASTPSHGDYVAPSERVGGWVMAGLCIAVAAGVWVAQSRGLLGDGEPPTAMIAIALVVPPLAVLLDELAADWLLRRRQVAATTLELAWDDALRARTLRDAVTVVIMAGIYPAFALVGTVGDRLEGGWPANPAVGGSSAVMLVLLIAGVATGIASLVSSPERHFRRRLWPRPVDGGVPTSVGAP